MRGDLIAKLKDPNDKTVFVLDGGQGTELERRGIIVSNPIWSTVPFLSDSFWNGEKDGAKSCDRVIVEGMYHDFITNSGCDVCMTITYQSSFKSLKDNTHIKTVKEYQELIAKIVQFTREVIGQDKYMIGCIGPYGAHTCSEFTGDYGASPESIDYYGYFKPQLDVFCFDLKSSSEIDLIGFETIPNFHELKAILALDEDTQLNKPFYIGLSCNDDGKLRDGTTISTICEYILQQSLENKINKNFTMLGVNCVSFKESLNMIKEMNKTLKGKYPLIVYPNSGEVYDTEKKIWLNLGNDNLSIFTWDSYVPQYIANNCKIIGGCCRTTPDDVKCVREIVDEHNHEK